VTSVLDFAAVKNIEILKCSGILNKINKNKNKSHSKKKTKKTPSILKRKKKL